jgi:hypothetical protein
VKFIHNNVFASEAHGRAADHWQDVVKKLMILPVDTHTCPNVHEYGCREHVSDHRALHTSSNTDPEHQKNSGMQSHSGNLGGTCLKSDFNAPSLHIVAY